LTAFAPVADGRTEGQGVLYRASEQEAEDPLGDAGKEKGRTVDDDPPFRKSRGSED
jgi:hypothetical protein